ncbi:porin [Hydrogenobaculum acidophilum]
MKKKLLLAMAVLGAAAWQGANAIVLKANDNEFANVGLELQIWAQNDGKVTEGQHSSNNFSVNNARVYFSGQINPIVQFGADLDFADHNVSGVSVDGTARGHEGTNYTRVSDAFINFKFMPELQLMAGLFRDPVSRLSNTDEYTYVIPTGYGYGFNTVWGNIVGTGVGTTNNNYTFANLLDPFQPITLGGDIADANRDAGIAIWGNVADTMLKYYLFAANGAYDYQAGMNAKGNLKYGIRLEFTPTMLGYKNSSGFVDQDTFLGALNNLTIGLGYEQQKLDCTSYTNTTTNTTTNGVPADNSLCGTNSSLTPKYYTIDANWQQKFGDFVPEVQLGWAEKKDLEQVNSAAKVKSDGYYVQLAALYDQVVGLGKPELAFRWEESSVKNLLYNGNTYLGDGKINRYSIFVNYYIAGEAAKMSLGADIVDPNSTLKNLYTGSNQLKDFTDWTLALQTEF